MRQELSESWVRYSIISLGIVEVLLLSVVGLSRLGASVGSERLGTRQFSGTPKLVRCLPRREEDIIQAWADAEADRSDVPFLLREWRVISQHLRFKTVQRFFGADTIYYEMTLGVNGPQV